MFAEVYLRKRLPRRFTFFDYEIPDNLEVEVGDLVLVPFKRWPTQAVVKAVKKKTEVKTLPLEKIIIKKLLDAADIQRFECLAKSVAQSVSSIVYAALPEIKNRGTQPTSHSNSGSFSISKEIASFLQTSLQKNNDSAFFQLSAEGEFALAALLRKKNKGQMLIILPRERDAEYFADNVPLGENVAVLHGKTKDIERESITLLWRTGKIETLIGTKQAALLAANNLKLVHVIDCSCEDYRQQNRNPRIDYRNAAELLARQHEAKIIYSGVTPRLSLINKIPLYWQEGFFGKFISLKAEEEKTNTSFLSTSLLKAIEKALQSQKSVLLSFNRKGVAKRLQCRACGYTPVCAQCRNVPDVRENDLICHVCGAEMWLPEKCPSCNKAKLSKRGVGNKELKKSLQLAFPLFKVGLIDKETQDRQADIQIVTEYFFKNIWHPFFKHQYGLVAELALDLSLGGNDFRSSEVTAYKLQRLEKIALQQKAELIVQTWLPDLTEPMRDLPKFLQHELELRRSYNLPPIAKIFKLHLPDSDETQIKMTAENQEIVYQDLQNKPDKCIIEPDLDSYDC
ncbi:MAG: helicase-related protein [Patescibacteria group bacterium]